MLLKCVPYEPVVECCKATVRSDEVKRWAKDAPTCLQSLIRLDVCGEDAAVGLSESFDVDFGAKSDGTGKQGDWLSAGGFRRGRSSRWQKEAVADRHEVSLTER